MKKIIIIFFIFLLQIIDAKALFHLKKDIKYVCEDKKGKKTLFIFDVKNKKVFSDQKDNKSGIDVEIGENYFSWEWDVDYYDRTRLDDGRYVNLKKFFAYLNTDTKQLSYDIDTLLNGRIYSVRFSNCEKLQ